MLILTVFADFDGIQGKTVVVFAHFPQFWPKYLVILACFRPFSARPNVHDFEVGFQFEQFHHIYRGAGKSKLGFVFISIPYGRTPEIGGLVYHFEQFLPEIMEMCHPRRSKMVIFADFLAKSVKNVRFPGSKRVVLAKPVKTVDFKQNRLKWPVLAILTSYGLKRASFDHFLAKNHEKMAKNRLKTGISGLVYGIFGGIFSENPIFDTFLRSQMHDFRPHFQV